MAQLEGNKFVTSTSFFIKCKETHNMCVACADFADVPLSMV